MMKAINNMLCIADELRLEIESDWIAGKFIYSCSGTVLQSTFSQSSTSVDDFFGEENIVGNTMIPKVYFVAGGPLSLWIIKNESGMFLETTRWRSMVSLLVLRR